MKRIVLAAATLLCACNVEPPANKTDAKARPSERPASARAPADPGAGRFFARDRGGGTHELALKSFSVRATTRPGTVRSHVTMEVASAVQDQAEAVMRLAVPPGAAVTSAVLWIGDRPMNGAFVERHHATSVYTSIVARRRDPALVTWDGPGWIAASIFPLEPNQPRRFELEWVEPAAVVDGQVQYRVPTVSDGDRVIGRAELHVDGRKIPVGDRMTLPITPADGRALVTGRAPGDPFQEMLVRAPASAAAPRFALVAETSAAMLPADRVRQRTGIERLFETLPRGAKVTLLAADWDASVIAEDVEAAGWPAALAKIDRIISAGALHLERALLAAAARARAGKVDALLFVGRGQDAFASEALGAPVRALRDAGARLSVVGVAGGDLPRALSDVATRTGGEAIAARAFEESLPRLVDALRPRPSPPDVAARSAGEWYTLPTVTGQTIWIGRALEMMAEAPTSAPGLDPAEAGDLAPLWHRARLDTSERSPGLEAEISTVLTPATALLVLETEQDYVRFNIPIPERAEAAVQAGAGGRHKGEDGKMGKRTGASRAGLYGLPGDAQRLADERAANAGILGVLGQRDGRAAEDVAPIFGRDSALGSDANDVLGGLIGNQIGQALGTGGLGLTGSGTGGGGTGEGTLGLGVPGPIGQGHGRGAGSLGGRRAFAPEVAQGEANVRGALDKEVVRRIVRRHTNEIKYCYEQQLTRFPGLAGRVVVQFTVAANGDVIASVLQSSTVANGPVETCILQAVRRWQFPNHHGGLVIISYPFVLTPGDGTAGITPAPIAEALAILAGPGSLTERIERASARLGHRPISDPEVLAWTIPRRGQGVHTGLLVARLLHLARRDHDAVRVLSESAGATKIVAVELRAIGAAADAAEVLRLAKR